MRIAHNELATWIRKVKRTGWLKQMASKGASAYAPNGVQTRLEIEDALRHLDDATREAVVYVHMLGYTYQEAAEAIGVPLGTLIGRAYRGRTKLRELLGERLDRERSG